MNYYIQGNKDNADQIRAAFEQLGYDISWPEGCAYPDVINIGVERNGAKYVVAETAAYIRDIIKTHPDYKELELPKPHYDISNFNPFDKVLVRCSNDEEWMIEFYCKYDTLVHTSPHRDYPFMGISDSYSQCIPFNDDTKHLLGTSDPCDEQYINW